MWVFLCLCFEGHEVHHVMCSVFVKYSRSVAMSCPRQRPYVHVQRNTCVYVIHWEVAVWGKAE